MKEINIEYKDAFVNELAEIENEIKNVDTLYNEIKSHYDIIKNSHMKGSLVFIEKQTSNLVTAKTAKLNLLKEKINIKKLLVDFNFKEENLKKSIEVEGNTDINSNLLKEIVENLKTNNKISDLSVNEEDEEFDESEIDEELDNVFKESNLDLGNIVDDKVDISSNEDEDDAQLVVDAEGNFYAVDENFEIISELGKLKKLTDKTILIDGDEHAVDTDGKTYLKIELEE